MRSSLTTLALCAAVVAPCVATAEDEGFLTGTVVLKDGRTFKGVKYKLKGRHVIVRRKYGDIRYQMRDIKTLTPDSGGEGGSNGPTGPRRSDWQTRFILEPPEDWEVSKPSNPYIRAQLRHKSRDATLAVTVRPALPPAWPNFDAKSRRTNVPREINQQIGDDLKAFYPKAPRPRVAVSTLHDSPVLRMDKFNVTPFGASRREVRVNTEVRFRQFGYEYALTYSVAKDDEGALRHTVNNLFGCFSFLPALTVTKQFYGDYPRGFALGVPSAEWALRPLPFSEDAPLTASTPDKRATLEVRIEERATAKTLVERMIRTRKARNPRHFSKSKVWEDKQDGSAVIRFQFRDFKTGETKQLQFKGIAFQREGSVLLIMGVAPRTDEDSRKLQGEVDSMLRSVKLLNLERVAGDLKEAKNAMTYLAQGTEAATAKRWGEAAQRYSDAIKLVPDYALAYFLRGVAKKEQYDFEGYKEDLEKAGELDPDGGYTKALDSARADEAEAAQKRKDWDTALALWSKVLVADKEHKTAPRAVAACGTQVWNKYKKDKDYFRGVKAVEGYCKRLIRVPEVATLLKRVYTESCRELQREKKFSTAKKIVRYFRSMAKSLKDDRMIKEVERLYDTIKKAQERR